jgi:hypothetical protein
MNTKLTVFFDDPFWVGVFERTDGGLLETARVVFGSEPKDYEVYAFILENYYKLGFSRPISVGAEVERRINPKGSGVLCGGRLFKKVSVLRRSRL